MGCATGVNRADVWVLVDMGILSHCQGNPEVAVLAPSAGTLDLRRICSEETMRVSDGAVARFPLLIGEGWEQ